MDKLSKIRTNTSPGIWFTILINSWYSFLSMRKFTFPMTFKTSILPSWSGSDPDFGGTASKPRLSRLVFRGGCKLLASALSGKELDRLCREPVPVGVKLLRLFDILLPSELPHNINDHQRSSDFLNKWWNFRCINSIHRVVLVSSIAREAFVTLDWWLSPLNAGLTSLDSRERRKLKANEQRDQAIHSLMVSSESTHYWNVNFYRAYSCTLFGGQGD